MKRKSLLSLLAIFIVFCGILAGCSSQNSEKASAQGDQSGESDQSSNSGGALDKTYTVKISYENQPGELVDRAAHKWKEIAAKKSDGKVQLKLYPSSQLGSKKDVIEQGKLGANVVQIADASFLQTYVTDIGILSGPYLVENFDQLLKLVESDWFHGLEKKLEDKGLHIVTTNWIYGARHLISTKKVTKPSDLNGMKIRVPDNPLSIKIMEAMGATATPMPLGEVYPSIAQGVIDGMENPLPVIYGSKVYEQAKHLSLTGHQKMILQWVAGQKYIESLPDKVVQILEESADEAGKWNNKELEKAKKESLKKLKDAGTKVTEVDVDAFKEATKKVYDQFPAWEGLYEKVQGIIKNQ